ncbi:MAG: hypothetical protein D6781_07095 [Verrucomicrobia bacterium]|nr:MAG: hypothetical protein D6781_07095 [Verrucomicrobiota bacterium]
MDDEEIIELSPFSITAEEDEDSYSAKYSLAGTRIRTELQDVGSAIQVVTQKFLQDTNSNSSEDLLVYTTNTEVAGQGGNFLGQGDGAVLTDTNRLAPIPNTRVRGLAEADNTRDFFLSDIPWDSYNVGRIDLQRGPNSILFGIGSPAGIVNGTTNAAAFNDSYKVEGQFGSYSSTRLVADLNKVLLDDELAVRVSALRDDRKYRQDPAFRKDERIYAAARWDPKFLRTDSASTSIRVNFEKGQVTSNNPRGTPPLDAITPWFTDLDKVTYDARSAATEQQGNNWWGSPGNPVWDGTVVTFDANGQGISWPSQVQPYPNPAGNLNGANVGDNSTRGIRTYDGYANATFPEGAIGAYKAKSLTDPSIFDFYNNLLEGPNKREFNNFEAFNTTIEQTFLDSKLGFELAYDWQKAHWGYRNFLSGDAAVITVDTNHTLLSGDPNPNVGRPLTIAGGGSAGMGDQIRSRETIRATGFYELNFEDVLEEDSFFARMLGRHVFTGLFSTNEVRNDQRTGPRFYQDALSPAVKKNAAGEPNPLGQSSRDAIIYHYFGPSLESASSPAGLNIQGIKNVVTPQTTAITTWNNVLNQWEAVPLIIANNDARPPELRQYTNAVRERSDLDSYALVWQGYLFDGNVVPMYGWRRDEQTFRSAGSPNVILGVADVGDPEWRLPNDANDLNGGQRKWNEVAGNSTTWGVVVHVPQEWSNKLPGRVGLSVFYNESENFQPDASRRDIFGNPVDSPSGETKDYGLQVRLFEDKLSLRWTHYKTTVTNANVAGSISGQYLIGAVEGWGQQAAVKFRDSIQPGAPVTNWPASVPGGIPYGISSDGFQLTWRPPGPSEPYTLRDENGNIIGYNYPQEVVDATFAREKASLDAWFATQVPADFQEMWGLSDYATGGGTINFSPAGLTVTGDTVSEGDEFEIVANPVRGLNIAFNASKTSARRVNLAKSYTEWIEKRWEEFQGPAGDMRLWGTDDDWSADSDHTGETARGKFQRETMAGYNLWNALQNSDVPELRKWKFNLIANYTFARDSSLKGVNVGGSIRYQDAATTGFPVVEGSDGLLSFDVANPYKGKSETIFDMWVGYERQLTEKLKWRVQLNVRNLFADDELIPVTVQPDGSPAAFRIPEPRTWFLTNSFYF